jgi:hypothetical protein
MVSKMMTFRWKFRDFFKKSYFQDLNAGNQSCDNQIKILEALRIWMIIFAKIIFFDEEPQKWHRKWTRNEIAEIAMIIQIWSMCFLFKMVRSTLLRTAGSSIFIRKHDASNQADASSIPWALCHKNKSDRGGVRSTLFVIFQFFQLFSTRSGKVRHQNPTF